MECTVVVKLSRADPFWLLLPASATYASPLNEQKKKWYKLSKSLAIWFPCLQSIIIESLDIQKWEIKRLIKNDFSLGNSTLILTFWSASYLQSDIFGSLNDQGLLSRASEALVAMDMKHPVSSAHQVFPQIKSDMMYSHPAISSSTAAGTSISRSSNQVLIFARSFFW